MRWVEITRLLLKMCRCRLLTPIFCSFAFLTFFFLYHRSHFKTTMLAFDEQFAPLLAGNERGGVPLFPGCDIYDGKWVYDETYPLYTNCSLAEIDFQCHRNGRPDRSYQKWRWQPHECTIPRFNAQDMLARLKGLKVVIAGDSMGRTQWESLSCLLLQAVPRKSSVVTVRGPITKHRRYIGTRFTDHDVILDYYRSPYLVREGPDVPKSSPERVHSTLKLKTIDKGVARNFVDADVLVLNTGHWWTAQKTYDIGCYFQVENKVMLGMPVLAAYKKAMRTITSWVNDHVNFSRTQVFFRSYEPPHWELPMATLPYSNIWQPQDYPKARILKQAVGNMQSPAMILNVTSLSSYRPDGHVFNWSGSDMVDCAHWCLPGVPDAWNELLYASLLLTGRGVWGSKNSTQ